MLSVGSKAFFTLYVLRGFTVHEYIQFNLHSLERYDLSCTNFHEPNDWSSALFAVCSNELQQNRKMNVDSRHKWSMACTTLIFTKFAIMK
jgi:hypothetical protein